MTQVSEISFCSRIGFNIKMDETKKRILEELESKFKFKVIQKHNEKYNDNIISKLNNNPHLISVRTNGNPYLLYLTKLNFVNQCIFVDKKVQSGYFLPRIIMSKFRFDDALFEGTLIDGEMVKDQDGNWIFMICDIIGYKGVYLENINLVKRLNIIYDIYKNQFCKDEYDVCHFQVKKYFRYEEIEYMITDFIPQLKYSCRGIYFKPLFLKFKDILYNFDDSVIQKVMRKKYKSISNFLTIEDKERIVSSELQSQTYLSKQLNAKVSNNETEKHKLFYVKKTSQPDVYELLENNIVFGNACIPSLKVSKMMRQLFQELNVNEKLLMNCEMSEKFAGKYVPLSPRNEVESS